jgi:FlaA1/EpsC-like NDP-sugar epimerase
MMHHRIERTLTHLLTKRIYLLVLGHVLIFAASYELSLRLRFDLSLPPSIRSLFWQSLPWVLVVKLAVFYWFGNYHGWWRYITFTDLAVILRASTLSTMCVALIDYFVVADYQIPRTVLLMDWGVTIFLLGGLRSVCRLAREHVWPALGPERRTPALLIGVHKAGESLIQQIHSHPNLDYRIVGLLDEDSRRHGSWLGGVPFVGPPVAAVRLAVERDVRDILVVTNSIPAKLLRRLMEEAVEADVHLHMIPPFDQIINGNYTLQVRDVNINDLLRREPVQLDTDKIELMLEGKRVLVSGAGGSIGSEICRQVLRCRPETLLLVERCENSLFYAERELRALGSSASIVPVVADIRDYERMHRTFGRWRPQIVFHAAAHKHVPLMECNPGEAINNNVFGTKRLADMAHDYEVDRLVLISTDKAVNPTSIMGVSKLLAERYIHACSENSSTKFMVVRFGNVLASAGSVVPIFQEQIRRGGPITVTHPEMRRFFMTIPEASQLVLQAAAMGKGGELFVLDMGKPVKIMDLAQDLVRLSGLSVADIEIEITGMRPGEKLYEELYLDHEEMTRTSHSKVWMANSFPCMSNEVARLIDSLSPLVNEQDHMIRQRLTELAPEYAPSDENGELTSASARADDNGENNNGGPGRRGLAITIGEAKGNGDGSE